MSRPLRVLVADDELLARRRLSRLLAEIDDVTIAGECTNGAEVIERARGDDVDVVLLDIHMPGTTGLEAMEALGDRAPCVVLCTAHADHALEAFEMGAVDYVMKPVEPARLEKALDRARQRVASRGERTEAAARPESAAPPSLARLAIPTRQGIVLVDPLDVSHAVIDGELVSVVTTEGTYVSDEPLGELGERLAGDRFARVHRRAIVNLARIARLEPTPAGGFVAHMRGGQKVEVSRLAARELRRRLGLR